MINPNVVDNVNPADLVDPAQQQKIAENVLNQLGLHPNQMGARNLLDLHVQGKTANPEIAQQDSQLINLPTPTDPAATAPKISPVAPAKPNDGIMDPKITGPVSTEPPAPVATAKIPPVVPKPDSDSSSLIDADTPSMPSPSAAGKIMSNTNNRTVADQSELDRLIRTGSGISQIHNPFLRGLATVGDVAGGSLFPSIEERIPGTFGHHNDMVKGQENLINTDLSQNQTESKTQEQLAHTKKDSEERNPNELDVWMKQNPGKSISEYWKQKSVSQGGKKTPDQLQMEYLTTPKEEGGGGLNVDQAYQQLQKDKTAGKPKTGAQIEAQFQDIMGKALSGRMDPKVMSDPKAIISAIDGSPNLTEEEKSQAHAYLASKTTPASQGGVASTRNSGILARGLTPVIDLSTGRLTIISPADHLKDPDRYVPATQGAQSMTKETAFRDMHFNADLTQKAFHNLKNGLDAETRAKLAVTLSKSDPTAWDSFWKSSVGQTLKPDQVDLVTALQSLHENALAMRSVQGLGQGSDELRAAIRGLVPGAETPSVEYADRQLAIFNAIVQRYESGVPKSGVKTPKFNDVPNTQDQNAKPDAPAAQGPKVFNRQQVQAVADQYHISYEAAKADAIKNGHKVNDTNPGEK